MSNVDKVLEYCNVRARARSEIMIVIAFLRKYGFPSGVVRVLNP